MNIISLLLDSKMPVDGVMLINNVFQTMLLCGLYMLFIEMFCAGIAEKRPLKSAGAVGLMLLPIAAILFVILILDPPRRIMLILCRFLPNVLLTEGGAAAVFLGVMFYLLRKKPLFQALALAVFSIAAMVMQIKNGGSPLSGSAQWLMALAAIPILLYNGKRGRGSKYFFYIFYPAHIYLFYIIAWFLRSR
jgi:hypothetical protein